MIASRVARNRVERVSRGAGWPRLVPEPHPSIRLRYASATQDAIIRVSYIIFRFESRLNLKEMKLSVEDAYDKWRQRWNTKLS